MNDKSKLIQLTLDFTTEEVERLIAFYETEKAIKKAELTLIIDSINKKIDGLKSKLNNGRYYTTAVDVAEITISSSYNPEWTWDAKIDYFLKLYDENGLTTSEMVEKIMEYEPTKERKTVLKSISSRLSVRAKKGEIYVKQNSRGQNVFMTFKGI